MKEIENPFLVYGYVNPDYFCDRKEETERLISALRNGRIVTLMSPRRMGKTGLIKNAFYHIQQENPETACFYIDLFSTNCLSDFVQLLAQSIMGQLDSFSQKAFSTFAAFLKSCRLVFSSDPLDGSPKASIEFQPSQAQNTLKEVFDYLKESGKECFIAIDEFQQITEYPEKGTEALLRSYIQFLPHVHFIFSGSKQHLMNEIFSSARRPFYRITEKMNLSVLPFDTYFDFAQHWMQKNGKTLSKDLFADIYERMEGHTWYMQYILNRLYGQQETLLTSEIVNQCIIEIVHSETDSYQQIYSMLTDNQRRLLRAIAHERKVESINASSFINRYQLVATSSVNTALKALINKELVFQSGNTYQVYDRFMALWLQSLALPS